MVTDGPARPSTRRYNAKFRTDIRAMPWVTTVFLVAERRACEACRLASAHYATAVLPPTPVPGCTRPGGCGCWFAAVAGEPRRPRASSRPPRATAAPRPATSTGRRTNDIQR